MGYSHKFFKHSNFSLTSLVLPPIVIITAIILFFLEIISEEYLITYLFILIILLLIVYSSRKIYSDNASPSITEPATWVFLCYIMLFIIKPLYSINYGSDLINLQDTKDILAFNQALFFAAIWLAIFVYFYNSQFSKKISSMLPKLPPLSVRRLEFWIPLLFTAGLAASLYLHIMKSPDEPIRQTIGTGHLTLFAMFLNYTLYLSIISYIKFRKSMFLIYSVIIFMFNIPILFMSL